MGVFQPRDIESSDPAELRRQLNAIQKALFQDLQRLEQRSVVSSVQTGVTYTARYGEVVRIAPASTGLRLILPPENLAQANARVVAVVEGSAGALSVEAVDSTINGVATLTYAAGLGTIEFTLTPDGWFAWSGAMIPAGTIPLTALANITGPTLLGRETGTGAPQALTGGQSGHLVKKAVVISASITVSQNNWSPTGLSTADTVFADSGATTGNIDLTGIDSSVFAELQGTHLVLTYNGVGTLTLSAGNALSLAANRFHSVGSFPVVLENRQSVLLQYCSIAGVAGWLILPYSALLTGATIGNRIRKANVLTPNLAATTNDWSPSGLVDAHAIYVTLTGSQIVTGLDATVFQANGNLAVGREIILVNADTVDTLSLSGGNPASLTGNRFSNVLGVVDTSLAPGHAVLLRREAPETTGNWRIIPLGGVAPALSVAANPTNFSFSSTRPVAASAARQAFMVNSANTALGWRAIEHADLPIQNSDTFLMNIALGASTPLPIPATTIDSVSVVWDAATATFQRGALTGEVTAAQNVNTLVIDKATNFDWTGEHTYAERAAAPSVAAGQGAFWPRNTVPSLGMYTDDTAVDHIVAYADVTPAAGTGRGGKSALVTNQTASAATTVLTGASFTIPAGETAVNQIWKGRVDFEFVGTAAPPNILCDMQIGGVSKVSKTVSPVANNGTYRGWVECYFTVRSSTLIMPSIHCRAGDDVTAELWGGGDVGTGGSAIVMADAQALTLKMNMATAVASNSLTISQGWFERIF